MSRPSNSLSRFWQELKRRNVVRVLALYAGTAYLIMEGSDIMLPRLGLPDWTVTLVIVLLLAGLPVTLILSWIFDLTPNGLKKTAPETELHLQGIREDEGDPAMQKERRRLRSSDVVIAVLFVAVCILLYPKIFARDQFKEVRDQDGRISVMVLPFENMTGDTLLSIWQDGIQDGIITGLSESKELSVRPFQAVRSVLSAYDPVNRASLSPALARAASEKLETNTYIRGSFLAAGNRLRINETLVNVVTDEIIKTFTVEGDSEEELLLMIDSLTWETRNYLEIKSMTDKRLPYESLEMIQTNSSEAFRNYIKGRELFMINDYEAAIRFFDRALEVDSSFALARFQRAFAYHNTGQIAENGGDMLKGREIHHLAMIDLHQLEDQIETLPFELQCMVRYLRSDYDKDPWEGIRQLEFMSRDEDNFASWWQLGINCYRVDQKERALDCFEKALEADQRWGNTSKWLYLYTMPAYVLHERGNHLREQEILEMGLKVHPLHPSILRQQAVCAYSRNDTVKARAYAGTFRKIKRGEGTGAPWIRFSMGGVYSQAGWHDSAIVVYRQLLEQYPQQPSFIDALGRELILSGIDVPKGVEFCSQAVEQDSMNWNFQVHRGNGYFKLDSLEKAQTILQHAWDERTFFDPENYRLLEAVNEALANRGNE
jgi:tetratricopeptide (TPR) repeat protein